MGQANGNIFGTDFYPTPRAIARRMVAKISDKAEYWLEPSAGKGDIADVIKNPQTWDEYTADKTTQGRDTDSDDRYYRSHRYRDEGAARRQVDVIESHPELTAVLRSKGYPVLGCDWLEYNGTSYYDAILMNPPFSNGATHLLKAWDFLHHGEIVCLLNQETIENPYTEERKRLVAIIKESAGTVEDLGSCFDTAERKTNVNVVMVYLKKIAPDDAADLWAKEAGHEKVYNVEVGDDPNMLAIRDNLANMEHWYNMANEHWMKGIEHLRKARLYMNQNKIQDYRSGENRDSDFKTIAGMALDNSNSSRTEFLRRHRLLAWTSVFTQMEFNRWLDSKQQDRFMKDVERDATIPFTAENIKGTLENVFLSRNKLFDESVANVFDELCSNAVENASGPERPACLKDRRGAEGWKTNDSYKVNERLIFPYGCNYDKDFNSFRVRWGDNADRIYSDLDRILSVLDARPFGQCATVGRALQIAFDRKHHSVSSQVTESQYFEIRFFKKGTVHLKWKRLDLLESFNKHAAAGKRWIGENTQQYRPTPRQRKEAQQEHWECRRDGCQFTDGVCGRCGAEDVDADLVKIPCELCRTVYEYTGEQYCPMHPRETVVVPAPAAPMLLLESAEPFAQAGLFEGTL